ncbi:hypothetical protein Prubr_34210 [Polymorphospora rubra]|uniref:Uncharacterized protein n=1 Tax=Polymorphospora rubra TaxID=338584 RepID=A0A810N0L4_9ACTN|nr:hypothetical protein Prubr_34210 [Polymorphospora rubra]
MRGRGGLRAPVAAGSVAASGRGVPAVAAGAGEGSSASAGWVSDRRPAGSSGVPTAPSDGSVPPSGRAAVAVAPVAAGRLVSEVSGAELAAAAGTGRKTNVR